MPQVGGFHLPKGTKVHISIWGVHHDEKFWPQPNVFRPERFLAGAAEAEGRHPNAFLGFGVGAWLIVRVSVNRRCMRPLAALRDFSVGSFSPLWRQCADGSHENKPISTLTGSKHVSVVSI